MLEGDFLSGYRYPLLAGVVAAVATLIITPLVRKIAIKYGALDDPKSDDRRIHTTPIPRWGGIAIFAGFLIAIGAVLPFAYPDYTFPNYLLALVGVCALIVLFGAVDDSKVLSARIQAGFLLLCGLIVQLPADQFGRVQMLGIESPLPGPDFWITFGIWAIPFTAIYLFIVAKTMDTVDGVDGLAAGIAGIAAATLSIIATYDGQPRVALVCAAISGACIGFLRYNYNPATIFMGTGGAQFLGFSLAALSIVGAMKTAAALAIFIPLLVFAIPIFDAVVVVIRRIASGQPITQADKRHLHHTLLNKGLSQRQTVWVLYGVAIVLSVALIAIVRSYG